MDERTCRLLAIAPPGSWSRSIVRLAAVRRYLEEGDRSVAAVDRHAAAAGIRRSLFYDLARIYAAADRTEAVGVAPSKAQGVHAGTVSAITDAMTQLGASASLSMVLERSREICRERGVPLATGQIVRTRYGRIGAGSATGERVRLSSDLAFDRTVLDLAVPAVGGGSIRVVLSCIVDMHAGVLRAHVLTAGDPSASDLRDMFLTLADVTGTLSIAESERSAHGIDIAALAREHGLVPFLNDRRRPGVIVRAAFGSRIGRIELVERRAQAKPRKVDTDLETARSVIAYLIRQHRSVGRSSLKTDP